MIEKTRETKVTNRARGTTGYFIPDLGVRRQFQQGETKTLTYEELEKLSWVPGGMDLLLNCLVIHDKDIVAAVLGEVEPEYYYSEQNIIKLMQNGTLDQFLDCLDYAPDSVKENIKHLAVTLPLNDVQKRNAIKDALNFDVAKAIELAAEDASVHEENKHKRRAAALDVSNEEAKPARRTSPYKIVGKTEENK